MTFIQKSQNYGEKGSYYLANVDIKKNDPMNLFSTINS